MIIEGRTVAVILLYLFTFIGYLWGKEEGEKEIALKQDKLKKIKEMIIRSVANEYTEWIVERRRTEINGKTKTYKL